MTTSVAQEQTAFELERFRWSDPDRLEVQGRWFGVRGRRFVRPVLTVDVDGRRRRLLAVLEHKPWTAEEGQPWVAVFPWEGPRNAVGDAELEVGSLTVDLPPPSGAGRRRRRVEKPAAEQQPAEQPESTSAPVAPEPEGDAVRVLAGEARGVLERDLAGARAELGRMRLRHEEEIRELRAEARRATERVEWAEAEAGKASAAAEEARAEAGRMRAELEAGQAERELLREEAERHRTSAETAEAELRRLRDASDATDRLRDVARRAVAEAEQQREAAESAADEADRLRSARTETAAENDRLRHAARKASAEAERLRAASRRPGAAPAPPPGEAAAEPAAPDQPAGERRAADPNATMPFDVLPADDEPAAEPEIPAIERAPEDDIAAAGPIDPLRRGAELPPMEPGQTVRRIPRPRPGSPARPQPARQEPAETRAMPPRAAVPRRIRPEPGAGAARLLGEQQFSLEHRTTMQVWGPRAAALILTVLPLIALALIVRGII